MLKKELEELITTLNAKIIEQQEKIDKLEAEIKELKEEQDDDYYHCHC